MPDEKPKSYYALNLTEGRIFIIFIAIMIIMIIIAFIMAFSFSKSKNDNHLTNIPNEQKNNAEVNNKLDYYENLSDNIETIPLNNDSSLEYRNEITQNTSPSDNSDSMSHETQTAENHPENITLDNSEILYASKYKDNNASVNQTQNVEEKKKELSQSDISNNKSLKTTRKTESIKSKQTLSVRYIVQIGSYKDPKTCDDIATYYKTQGYPAFIKTINLDGKKYYRLRIGPFKEKNRAQEYLVSLKSSKYGKDSYISIIYL